jgi:hypothetical protein
VTKALHSQYSASAFRTVEFEKPLIANGAIERGHRAVPPAPLASELVMLIPLLDELRPAGEEIDGASPSVPEFIADEQQPAYDAAGEHDGHTCPTEAVPAKRKRSHDENREQAR